MWQFLKDDFCATSWKSLIEWRYNLVMALWLFPVLSIPIVCALVSCVSAGGQNLKKNWFLLHEWNTKCHQKIFLTQEWLLICRWTNRVGTQLAYSIPSESLFCSGHGTCAYNIHFNLRFEAKSVIVGGILSKEDALF